MNEKVWALLTEDEKRIVNQAIDVLYYDLEDAELVRMFNSAPPALRQHIIDILKASI